MTDTEINEAVAKKLGWVCEIDAWDPVNSMWRSPDGSVAVTTMGSFPICSWATDIKAAWEIVERFPAPWFFNLETTGLLNMETGKAVREFTARFAHLEPPKGFMGCDKNPATAICKAFLAMP